MKTTNARRTILVIEDDRAVRELMKLHLVNAGYNVLLAEDAVVGGPMLLEQKPDLLVIDAKLPYLSGIDFVATLTADSTAPCPPVIFITGHEELSLKAHALTGACLVKPFLANDLLELVFKLLGAPATGEAGIRRTLSARQPLAR